MTDVIDDLAALNGRQIAYSLYGGSATRQVLFQYGTPGVRWLAPQMIRAAERAGCALLVVDRPGYGLSDRRPGRRVVDVVEDVATVLDTVGWQRCAVWGGSGGAPHALALAARLPGRVTACASVVGLAPFDASGLDWYEGMAQGNVEEFTAARGGEKAYRPVVKRLAAEALQAVEGGGIQVADDYELPESDRVALAARRLEDGYLDRMRATYASGVDGWIDDGIAFTQPWGFDLNRLSVPVSVWYGVEDVLAPRDHAGYLLSAVPAAQGRELSGGHVLNDDDLDAVYAWLAMYGEDPPTGP